jgi:hypothetical protein
VESKRIHITFDYELFFGPAAGTIEKCLLEPTERLLLIAAKTKSKFVFFVDAGFLWRLKQYQHLPICERDYQRIKMQLQKICEQEHEIALHVHPHWEDSFYEEGWKINTQRYKLSDFNQDDITQITTKYHEVLTELTGVACTAFRAGGWCIQPFTKIKEALIQNQIFCDSSVYPEGYHQFSAQSYDFRKAPKKSEWRFEDDECNENLNGKFLEISITPDKIGPLFYFKMYANMRIHPSLYKPLGDGMWLKDKRKIRKHFYSYTSHFACCDGFFASRLKKNLRKIEAQNNNRMVVLGHPKSMAEYSFEVLSQFIEYAIKKNWLVTTFK